MLLLRFFSFFFLLIQSSFFPFSHLGERVWPFPIDDDFDEDLKSDVADVLQCRQPTEGDHLYATIFLKRYLIFNHLMFTCDKIMILLPTMNDISHSFDSTYFFLFFV